jgi:hypothetical protein
MAKPLEAEHGSSCDDGTASVTYAGGPRLMSEARGGETMKRYWGVLVAVGLILGATVGAGARPVQLWYPADLWKKAQLVVVGTAKGTKDTCVEYGQKPTPEMWVSVDTAFQVEAVPKGKLKGKTVQMRHHRYYGSEAEVNIIDGPSFVEFNPAKQRKHMLFLKRGADGSWEPLTGQYDPWQSVIVLQEYHRDEER